MPAARAAHARIPRAEKEALLLSLGACVVVLREVWPIRLSPRMVACVHHGVKASTKNARGWKFFFKDVRQHHLARLKKSRKGLSQDRR
jgi:hypothetical protein